MSDGANPVPTYSFRSFDPGDIDAISRVHRQACLIAYRFMNWSYSEDEVRDWYAGKMSQWDWGLVASAGTEVVAYVTMTGGHVDQLFVDPNHQRVGLGRALLTTALDRGLRPATLHVFAENAPARRLYDSFGFREVDSWWSTQDGAVMLLYRLD